MSKLTNYFTNELSNLTSAEKYIFYFIDSHVDMAKNLSLTAMANETNVSTTTIIRMCNKLQLSGFSELKYILKHLDDEDKPHIDNYIDSIKSDINLTIDKLSMDNIEQLVHLIDHSKKIIIVSVGLSKPMGEYFSKLLMQAKKSSFYVYESHIIDLLDQSLTTDDLVIFISNSGETQTLVKTAEKLNFKHFHTAAIVNNPTSRLSTLVDISINTYSEKKKLLGYDITPRSTLTLVLDIIFAYYISKLQG